MYPTDPITQSSCGQTPLFFFALVERLCFLLLPVPSVDPKIYISPPGHFIPHRATLSPPFMDWNPLRIDPMDHVMHSFCMQTIDASFTKPPAFSILFPLDCFLVLHVFCLDIAATDIGRRAPPRLMLLLIAVRVTPQDAPAPVFRRMRTPAAPSLYPPPPVLLPSRRQ